MYIANVTNDYDNITNSRYRDYENMIISNCTNNENNIGIIIPILLLKPCGLSFLCLMGLMVYTLIKPLFNKKKMMEKNPLLNIQLDVS